MNRYLIVILPIVLLACGGTQTGDSTPAGETKTTPAGDESPAPTGDESSTPPGDETAATAKDARKATDAGEFKVNEADKASRAKGSLKATKTEAAVRLFVVDKDKGPIEGIVISLKSPSGKMYYTEETDAKGFGEVLVPIGHTYDLVYLSLGRTDVAAKVKVANKPKLNVKLTLRYKKEEYDLTPAFVLENVEFETGKAKLIGDSRTRLDVVVAYMTHKKSARIQISGHTDNVGRRKANKRLSQRRANAVRDYIVSKGIDASRLEAVGYGDSKPIAPNDTGEGRQKNRRIEATEL
jgi:outer membrane protein OmpA-like peptidoglycan-associated protein